MSKESKLISDYEQACNEIARLFANKQGLKFEGWVADDVGSVGDFSGIYYFSISEIVLDLKTNQPKGLIMRWQDENVEHENDIINYYSYTKGLRHSMLTKVDTSGVYEGTVSTDQIKQ